MTAFTWSFSKVDNFETCAKKYYNYSVAPKDQRVVDQDTDNIKWGNEVHDAMRDAIKKVKPLPEYMLPYQPWVDRVLAGPGDLMVEQKLGLSQDLSPCPYFGPTIWYRGIVDVARINGKVGLAIDWKTGSPKDNSVQLGLMALCLFQHYPSLVAVRTDFVWLKLDPNDPAATTMQVFKREDMPAFVSSLLPRVQKLEWAHKNSEFPPNPSGLCVRYCGVVSCPFHGKGNRQ